jgi:hypothetical protein
VTAYFARLCVQGKLIVNPAGRTMVAASRATAFRAVEWRPVGVASGYR